jgi:hypothetical protein
MATETKKIIVRKGLSAQLPDLDEGEPGFATDTQKLYVGTSGTSNVELSKEGHTHAISNVTNLQTTLDTKANLTGATFTGNVNLGTNAITANRFKITSDSIQPNWEIFESSNKLSVQAIDGGSNPIYEIWHSGTSHTHSISAITDLQTTLDSKATPSDITTAINNLVASAPGALDTLDELAAALGDDANFATTVTNALAGKAATSHTHTLANITNAGSVATVNLSNNSTQFLNGIGSFITPGISNITSLQTALDAKAPLVHTHNLTSSRTLIATRSGSQITSTAGFSVADLDQFQEIEVVFQTETQIDSGDQNFTNISAVTVAKCERSAINFSSSSNAPLPGSETNISSLQLVITGVSNATIGTVQVRQENEGATLMSLRTFGTIPSTGANVLYIYGIVILDN